MINVTHELVLPFLCDGRQVCECEITSPTPGTLTSIVFYRGQLNILSVGDHLVKVAPFKAHSRGVLYISLPSPLHFSFPVSHQDVIRIQTTEPTKGYLTLRKEPVNFL